jgi:hypothetical protein
MKEPKEVFQALMESGNDMCEQGYQYRLLDDATKSILAQLTIEARGVEGVTSQAEALSIALCTHTYRDHIAACAEAHRLSERSKIRYYSTKSYADHCRTKEASERAAMHSAT